MFNIHNPTELAVLRQLAYGEGIITKAQFLELANRTMLSKYRTAGLIRQMPNAREGVYQITDKFKSEYLRRIDPTHKFSGSGSPTHAAALYEALTFIPKTAELITGQALKDHFARYQRTVGYHQQAQTIREDYQAQRQEAKAALAAASPDQKAAALDRYRAADQLCRLDDDLCSTADLAMRVSREEIDTLLTDIGNRYLNDDHMTQRQAWACSHAIRTLQAVQDSMTEQTAVIMVEAITDSYGRLEIEQKENYSAVMHTPIIYFAAEGAGL